MVNIVILKTNTSRNNYKKTFTFIKQVKIKTFYIYYTL